MLIFLLLTKFNVVPTDVLSSYGCNANLLLGMTVQAQDFRTQGTQIRRKMWFQNMKIKLIVLGILIALILIIVLSVVCGGGHCR